MTNHKNIPALRFKEFVGEWEVKKLGELAKFSKGKGISKKDISDDGIECIRYGELYTTYGEVIEEIQSKTNIDKDELVFSQANDVIIPASGETAFDIATASCVINDGIALGGDLNIIRTKINGVFLSYYLNNALKIPIARLAQGVSVSHLYSSQLKTLKLNLPTEPEQQKIANFLTAIDKKIQQLREKHRLLEAYKKGMMQQIFKQEIRFKDVDGEAFGDWEVKRLGEIGFFKTSSVDKKIVEGEEIINLVNYMNVYRHENISNSNTDKLMKVSAKVSQIETNNLKKGDILFTPSSETPSDIGHSVVIFEDLENTLYSYHLLRFRPTIKLDILYSHYFCNIPFVLKQMSRFATGSTRFTISVGSFSKVKVMLPELKEQQKIANFLSSIDEKIGQVREQVQAMEGFKKGLLQGMFV